MRRSATHPAPIDAGVRRPAATTPLVEGDGAACRSAGCDPRPSSCVATTLKGFPGTVAGEARQVLPLAVQLALSAPPLIGTGADSRMTLDGTGSNWMPNESGLSVVVELFFEQTLPWPPS